MRGPLDGRVALVTGARHGIGAATALALAGRGAAVVASGRGAGDCAAIVAAIRDRGGEAGEQPLDLAETGAIGAGVDAAAALFGRLDIVVNNAGVIEPMTPIAALEPAAFELAMRINVTGPAAVIAAAWRHFGQGGRIVNVLSGAALKPLHGWAAYCAGKAALLMLTRAADLEGAEAGIRCFGIAPGLVDTAMQARIRAAHINAISDIPQARLTPPDEAGAAIAWLASGAADAHAGTMVDIRDAATRAAAGLAQGASHSL